MAAITLSEKTSVGYVNIANAIASESPTTENHAQRLIIGRQMAQGGGAFSWYVANDFIGQDFTDATSQSDINNRLSALLTNLILLGFGGMV